MSTRDLELLLQPFVPVPPTPKRKSCLGRAMPRGSLAADGAASVACNI